MDSVTTLKNIKDQTYDLAGQKLTRLVVTNCSNLKFINGEFIPATVKEQVLVQGSTGISFDGVKLTANDGLAYAFRIADCSDITIQNCRIDRPFQGINAGRIKGLKILNNMFLGTNNDSILICNDEDVLIEGNIITGSLRLDLRHPDAIQFLSKDGLVNKNVIVRRNIIAGSFQGIFGGQVAGITIEGNYIRCDHGNGIAVNATEIRLIDNVVGTWPGAGNLCNINLNPVNVIERHGNVREAWGRFAVLRD